MNFGESLLIIVLSGLIAAMLVIVIAEYYARLRLRLRLETFERLRRNPPELTRTPNARVLNGKNPSRAGTRIENANDQILIQR
jgi:hypothetical protein